MASYEKLKNLPSSCTSEAHHRKRKPHFSPHISNTFSSLKKNITLINCNSGLVGMYHAKLEQSWKRCVVLPLLLTLPLFPLLSSADQISTVRDDSDSESKSSTNSSIIGSRCSSESDCATQDRNTTCMELACQCRVGYHLNPLLASNATLSTCLLSNDIIDLTREKRAPFNGDHMLPIMIVMGVMFAGMCVALNLFSRARFRNTRSVFNTSNPRLIQTAKARAAQRKTSSDELRKISSGNVSAGGRSGAGQGDPSAAGLLPVRPNSPQNSTHLTLAPAGSFSSSQSAGRYAASLQSGRGRSGDQDSVIVPLNNNKSAGDLSQFDEVQLS